MAAVSCLVTLRVLDDASSLNKRLIALHPGDTVALGRESKNQKRDYIAKATNGYFDNPIVSRHHAMLENRAGEVSHAYHSR